MNPLGVSPRATPCLVLDIGATKVDVALIDGEGNITERVRLVVTEHPSGLIDQVIDAAQRVVERGRVEPTAVGVGCAGPMTVGGATVSPLNITQWRDFPLRDRLEGALGLPVFVEGDARALALAEGAFGAAVNNRSYLSMVVSTGVGGGLVLDRRLVDGDSGNAGHIGHLNVVPDGALCSCGSYGCLEAEASGLAIEARTGRLARDADGATRDRTATLVGRAVGSLASVLDFNHCYVAGSVALGFGDDFFTLATKSARSVAQMSYTIDLEVSRTGLGEDGPLLGAAMVAWRGTNR